MKTVKKIINEIENLSEVYHNDRPSYNTHTRQMLERRWQAYKFIKLGIHSRDENKIALALCERLIDISNTKHENPKDEWLLVELAKVIEKFEKKEYSASL